MKANDVATIRFILVALKYVQMEATHILSRMFISQDASDTKCQQSSDSHNAINTNRTKFCLSLMSCIYQLTIRFPPGVRPGCCCFSEQPLWAGTQVDYRWRHNQTELGNVTLSKQAPPSAAITMLMLLMELLSHNLVTFSRCHGDARLRYRRHLDSIYLIK